MNVVNFNMMVGLQGSGKSTFVKKELKRLGVLCNFSADKIREEFPEENNEQIFTRYYKELDDFLKLINPNPANVSFNVYLDNTHFQLKARRSFFDHLSHWKKKYFNISFKVNALIMSTPFELCLERVKQREKETGKVIPEEVLYKYRASFNIPFYEEGFNEIKIIDGITLEEITKVECDNKKYATMMYKMINFDQENPHHRYTLGIHMVVCQQLVLRNMQKFNNSKCMYIASVIHDWGKYYTKSYNDNGIGIYYNHSEVGTYELLSNLELIPQKDFTMNEILRVLTYINYHMRPFDWNTEKALHKAYDIYGGALINDLIEFNKIDKKACGTESEQITG